ncbi:MAG: glycoside hydrolase family 38 C-terminal domain-containing protein [Candidatus Thermoplasmatota archaeon]|nr:glycoside hydrolase family 38 C-terminal domain-containing protein [Candidatus Thermoplasmatota archaeon]
MAPAGPPSEDEDDNTEGPSGPPSRGPPRKGPPRRGPPSRGPPAGPQSGPPSGPPSGPQSGPPQSMPDADAFTPPSSGPRGPPSGPSGGPPPVAEENAEEDELEEDVEEPIDEGEDQVESKEVPKRGPPSRGPPSKGPPSRGPPKRGPPSKGPPTVEPEIHKTGEEESLFDAALSRMTGREEDIVDAEELAAEEAAAAEQEEIAEENEEEVEAVSEPEESGEWEDVEEEEDEPLPEIEPLPGETAEGSRYPKLKKANTGRLKDADWAGHIVPHTHWDRAWYLPFQKYRYKLVELVDDLLDLMENNPKAYPSFELDGQTVILEDYLEVKPENADRIKKLVEKGRLNIGPWYVLPDEYIVGGEALVRNLLMGARTAEQWGGRSEVGYVPDPFGHVAQLPAILKGSGLDSFIFTRGAGPWIQEAGGIFNWYASDGKSKVLAVQQVPDYPNLMAWGFEERPLDRKDSLDVNIESAMGRMERLLDKHEALGWKPDVLLFGQGSDHTHPQPTLPMLIGKASQKFNGRIKFQHSSFPAYIEALRAWLGKKKVFKYQGELHSGWDRNILSGVFSARLYLKRSNDFTMRLLKDKVEQLAAISCAQGGRFRGERLDLAWREVLRNHPHDDICGCSVDETHDDMEVRFKHAQQIAEMLEEDVRVELCEQMDLSNEDRDAVPLVFHNPLAKAWSGSMMIDIAVPKFRCWLDHGLPVKIVMAAPAGDCLMNTSGLTIQPKSWDLHVHHDRVANVELPRIVGRIHVHRLPPGISVAHALPGRGTYNLPGEPVSVGGEFGRTDWMDNGLVRVLFRADGRFDVLDHSTGRHVVGAARLEDSEDAGDSYDWSAGGHPVPQAAGRGEKMSERIEATDCRFADEDEENRQVYLSIEHQSEWATTIRLHIAWSLPARFDDVAQKRSEEMEWNTIDHYITLRSGHKMVEVETWVNNASEDHRLRLHIPTGCDTKTVHAGAAFDIIERPANWPHHADWEQPHVPTHHFSDLLLAQERDGGVALFCPGSNEYEAITSDAGTTLAVTLLRATGYLSRDGFASRRNRAGPVFPAPGAQCKGAHWTRWAIMAYEDDWSEAEIHQVSEAYACNASVLNALPKPQLDGEFDEACTFGTRGVRLQPVRLVGDGPMPIIACVKPAADGNGTIVRLYNPTDQKWDGRIETDLPLFNVRGCDLLENATTKPRISKSGWPAKLNPKSIGTWRFN